MILPEKYTNPVLTAKVVQDLQEILESLTWLEYVYPLVRVGMDKDKTIPVCYKNDGGKKIISVFPDSKVGAFAFFEMEGPTPIPDDSDDWYVFNLSLTVWYNLSLIYTEKEYDYTHELIQDVKSKLDSGFCHDFELEERPGEVFEKYTGLTDDFAFLMPPYGAFKLKFTIEK